LFPPFPQAYPPYVNNYVRAHKLLEGRTETNEELRVWLYKTRKNPGVNHKDLDDFLINPVQRMPRYVMLVRELLEHTWDDHPDYGALVTTLKKIEEGVVDVNEKKRTDENTARVASILGSIQRFDLSRWPQLTVLSGRELIREGTLHEWVSGDTGHGDKFHYFLFSDFLVWAKPRRKKDQYDFHKLCFLPELDFFLAPVAAGGVTRVSCKVGTHADIGMPEREARPYRGWFSLAEDEGDAETEELAAALTDLRAEALEAAYFEKVERERRKVFAQMAAVRPEAPPAAEGPAVVSAGSAVAAEGSAVASDSAVGEVASTDSPLHGSGKKKFGRRLFRRSKKVDKPDSRDPIAMPGGRARSATASAVTDLRSGPPNAHDVARTSLGVDAFPPGFNPANSPHRARHRRVQDDSEEPERNSSADVLELADALAREHSERKKSASGDDKHGTLSRFKGKMFGKSKAESGLASSDGEVAMGDRARSRSSRPSLFDSHLTEPASAPQSRVPRVVVDAADDPSERSAVSPVRAGPVKYAVPPPKKPAPPPRMPKMAARGSPPPNAARPNAPGGRGPPVTPRRPSPKMKSGVGPGRAKFAGGPKGAARGRAKPSPKRV
jgi:RhoGEF domain